MAFAFRQITVLLLEKGSARQIEGHVGTDFRARAVDLITIGGICTHP